MPVACPTCLDRAKWCPACRGSVGGYLYGVAVLRGERWAERVRRVGLALPWPAYEESERVRGIAQRLVADLGDPEGAELLARWCYEGARRWRDERRRRAGGNK